MPCVEYETTTPGFERMNTFHALDRAATVIGEHYVKIVHPNRSPYYVIINMLFLLVSPDSASAVSSSLNF
jgi:hypothetical protein